MKLGRILVGMFATADALTVFAQAPSQGIASAHWKSVVSVEGARPGAALQQAEIWLRGPVMRIVAREGGSPDVTNLLELDGQLYVWTEGHAEGLRIVVGLAANAGRPSYAYVRRVDEIRSHGKKLGSETVAGHLCDVYDYDAGPAGAGKYWLAGDLKGFPVQAVVERRVVVPMRPSVDRGGVKLLYRNTDVEVPGKVPDALLAVPQGVRFQDATELMGSGRPPRS